MRVLRGSRSIATTRPIRPTRAAKSSVIWLLHADVEDACRADETRKETRGRFALANGVVQANARCRRRTACRTPAAKDAPPGAEGDEQARQAPETGLPNEPNLSEANLTPYPNFKPNAFSMSSRSGRSGGSASVSAWPVASLRPVRPTRCT